MIYLKSLVMGALIIFFYFYFLIFVVQVNPELDSVQEHVDKYFGDDTYDKYRCVNIYINKLHLVQYSCKTVGGF